MFRIKTDIRQYNCESREKVERLIRNWVIRPTDLIFDDEKQEWGPIGEHAEFVSTFAELAKREAEAPDTIVSSETPADEKAEEPPDKPPVARRDRDTEEDVEPPEPPEGIESDASESDEITVMTEETLEKLLEEKDEGDGDVPVVDTRSDEVSDVASGEEPRSGEISNVSPGEGTRSGEISNVSPPEASQPAGDSEDREITRPEAPRPRMDRRESGDGETPPSVEEPTDPEGTSIDGRDFSEQSPPDPASESDEVAEVSDEELRETDLETEDAAEVSDEELRDTDLETDEAPDLRDEDLRDTDEIDEDEEGEEGRSISGSYDVGAGGGGRGGVRAHADEQVGRHDLPEEIFATNEINESVDEQDGSIDELAEESGAPAYADVEEALQENARRVRRQQHVDDEWDEILNELRDTDELSKEELEEITKTRDQIAVSRDEGDDEIDESELDEIDPDEIEEYVSEGYSKELPIEVGPTSRDIQLGLRRSKASTESKDRVFPYPEAKQAGRVERRSYGLRRSKDYSLVLIAAVVGAVVFLILAAVFLF